MIKIISTLCLLTTLLPAIAEEPNHPDHKLTGPGQALLTYVELDKAARLTLEAWFTAVNSGEVKREDVDSIPEKYWVAPIGSLNPLAVREGPLCLLVVLEKTTRATDQGKVIEVEEKGLFFLNPASFKSPQIMRTYGESDPERKSDFYGVTVNYTEDGYGFSLKTTSTLKAEKVVEPEPSAEIHLALLPEELRPDAKKIAGRLKDLQASAIDVRETQWSSLAVLERTIRSTSQKGMVDVEDSGLIFVSPFSSVRAAHTDEKTEYYGGVMTWRSKEGLPRFEDKRVLPLKDIQTVKPKMDQP